MILTDTNVWIDHLRRPDPRLTDLLARREVVMHPFVMGEIMLGSLSRRDRVAQLLGSLRQVAIAPHEAALEQIEKGKWFGTGLSYVDAHLLISCQLSVGQLLWTRDKRLLHQAAQLSIAAPLA